MSIGCAPSSGVTACGTLHPWDGAEVEGRIGATSAGATMAVKLRALNADDRVELDQVRQFFRNYAGWLGVDLCFQGFDEEMASLPGAYCAPKGRLVFAEFEDQPGYARSRKACAR